MVRFLTFALLALSATAIARPTHRRRNVCKTSTTSVASATVTPANNEVITSTKSGFVTKTKTTTSSKATSTSSSDSGDDNTGSSSNGTVISGSTGSASAVFPVSDVTAGWTVAQVKSPDAAVDLTLSSNTLIVTKQAKGSSHPVIDWQGKKAIHAHIPKGALTPGTQPYGGFSFYSPGASKNGADIPIVKLETAKEVTFGYSVYFSKGYDFNLGGKLPGLYGGVSPEVAATCSGGRHNPGCYSARLMFRPGGAGELYLYIPPHVNNNDNFCGKAASSKCESSYGESVGRGTWYWKAGEWVTVTERILLNTPGKADGEAQIYVNGKSVLFVKGITWRTSASAVFQGIQMQIFHGGHESNWASPKDQDVYFSDFTVGITQKL